MSELETQALFFAAAKHGAINQRRKYTGQHYIVHPIAVAEIVKTVPNYTDEMVAAALLHDTVEDTNTTLVEILAEFGPVVAELVDGLTDVSKPEDGNRAKRKEIDRQHLAKGSREVHTIKLADIIDNAVSIKAGDPDFWRVFRHEIGRLLDVLKDGDQTLWDRVAAIYANIDPGPPEPLAPSDVDPVTGGIRIPDAMRPQMEAIFRLVPQLHTAGIITQDDIDREVERFAAEQAETK